MIRHFDPRVFWARTSSWVLDKYGRSYYVRLSEAELIATRRSETVFIFGSGYSINDVTKEEWNHFSNHDTISFNWFPHQKWVRIDYHFIREVATRDLDRAVWLPALTRYGELIRENPFYARTVFVVQGGWKAVNGNRMIGRRLLAPGLRLFRFGNRARDRYEPPSESFSRGLAHSALTLGDCVNFAYLVGWRSIVLVGVDMYDHRYFWLDRDEARADVDMEGRGLTVADPFAGAARVIRTLEAWGVYLSERGVSLTVYNPRSLLAGHLPIYPRPG
jgi:hypothetical protein